MDLRQILQALDSISTKPVENVVAEEQVPPMPDVSDLQPGTSKDGEEGSRITKNADGTVSYAGAWGTYVYNAQGQHVKTVSPTFAGYSQTSDPTGKVTQQTYNQGPLNVKRGPEGDEVEYDLGTTTLSAKGPTGAKPTQVAVREMGFKDYLQQIEEGLKDPKDNPCWKGYKPVGTKKKGGRTVPNCVPKE